MAERKSGPVKPPVIELKARPAESAAAGGPAERATAPKPDAPAQPEEKPSKPATAKSGSQAAKSAEPAKSAAAQESPRPAAGASPASGARTTRTAEKAPPPSAPRARSPWPAAGIGGILGAAIAVAVCYGLAETGYWPMPGDTDARIAALETGLAQTEKSAGDATAALADVNTRLAALQSDASGKLNDTAARLAALGQAVDKLQAAPAKSVDLGPLEAQLKTLAGRVDAVAAGASSADAGAIAANLATVQQNLADLSSKLSALEGHAGQTDNAVSALKSELDTAKGAIDKAAAAPSREAIATALQLPLLISALEADFDAGRPYAGDLAALTAAVPEARVPASVSEAAPKGLPAADAFVRSFEAKMPDMLAALPSQPRGDWQDQLTGWVRSTLAIRPEGEQQGDSPAAVLSRVETAVIRHDFATAAKAFDTLPAPTREAAGEVGSQLHALAEANAFVAGLRQNALKPAGAAS
jgi:hypothetical protein